MPRGKVADRSKSPSYWEYYKALEPNLSQEECEEKAMFRRKSVNKRTIEYYQVNFPDLSPEEQEEKRQSFLKSTYENHPCHIEYYQKNFPNLSPEEQQSMFSEHMKESNSQNINFFKKRYPDLSPEEQQEMLEKSRKYHATRQPKLLGKKNPNHSSNCTDLERRQRSPKCIEFYELRYPDKTDEERQEMLSKHIEKTAKCLTPEKHQTKKEYWIAKGYSEIEARQKVHERQQTFSLEKCIKKYGEEKGREVFEERQRKWQESLHQHFNIDKIPQSKLAINVKNDLSKKLNDIECEFQVDKYSFDYKFHNILIEVNGDYWHCNPAIYDEDFYNKVSQKTAKETWEKDQNKIKAAEDLGYKVYTIWEMDYNKAPNTTITKCLKFIKENVVY